MEDNLKPLRSRISAFLDEEDQSLSLELKRMVAEYCQRRERMDERLTACCALIEAGKMAEALNAADLSPALLAEAAALTLERHDEWRGLCDMYGLSVPAPLDAKRVESVAKAFEGHVKLEPLLQEYRRLAQDGSVHDRLMVARRLVQAAPENFQYQKQLSDLADSRAAELKEAAKAAIQAHDEAAVNAIKAELAFPDLAERIDEKVSRKLAETLSQWRTAGLETRAASLAKRLQSAYELGTLPEAVTLVRELDMLEQDADYHQVPERTETLSPAREWIDGELSKQAWQKRCESLRLDLEAALEDKRLDDAERAWFKLEREGYSVPEMYARKLEGLREEVNLDKTRRFRRLFALVALGVVVLLVGSGWVVRQGLRQRLLNEVSYSIKVKIDKGDLPGAKAVLALCDTEHRYLSQYPIMAELRKRLEEEERLAKGRLRRGQEIIAELGRQQQDGFAATGAEALLTEAKALRPAPELQVKFEALETELGSCRAKQQQQRDEGFAAAVSQLNAQVEELRKLNPIVSDKEYSEQLAACEKALEGLRQRNDVSAEVSGNNVEVLAQQCAQANKRQREAIDKKDEFIKLRESLRKSPNGQEYLRGLEQLVTEYQEVVDAKAISAILDAKAAYNDFGLRESVNLADPLSIPALEPNSVWLDSLPAVAKYLEKYKQAKAEISQVLEELKESKVLKRQVATVSLVGVVGGKLKRCFIVPANTKVTMSSRSLDTNSLSNQYGAFSKKKLRLYFDDRWRVVGEGATYEQVSFPKEQLPEGRIPEMKHSEFIEKVLPGASPSLTDWANPESVFLRAVTELNSLEPFSQLLKLRCSLRLLKCADLLALPQPDGKPMEVYAKLLAQGGQYLKGLSDKDSDWVKNETDNGARAGAIAQLSSILDLNPGTLRNAERAFAFTMNRLAVDRCPQFIGYVGDASGTAVLKDKLPMNAEIWVVSPSNGGTPRIRVVGKLDGLSPSFYPNETQHLKPWMPLFAPADGKSTAKLAAEARKHWKQTGEPNWPRVWPENAR